MDDINGGALMLLLRDDQLSARRATAAGGLKPLADSLAADLEPVLSREIFVPTEKALLSKAGGRCPDDGTQLEFDPFSPRTHRCAHCGHAFEDDLHYRWWLYPYQLWLAERAVHAALLFLLRGDARHATLANDILLRYSDQYLRYPNKDNVLGPARVFFSTYLESMWLLQLCVAMDFLEAAGNRTVSGAVRDKIVAPSAALIRQYDEGLSNRQVWNNAALIASSMLLDDLAGAERAVHAPSGVQTHLALALLPDGTWYEGENYHLFAHRGLWYNVTMAESAGMSVDATLVARFQEGFATPFGTALPDFTFPPRKDSQYAVSLRQWRYAELCELGLARTDDRRLIGALARIYDDAVSSGDTGRAHSSAEAERNVPAVRLSRADLGWRSLLHAREQLPALERVPVRSAHLEHQGFTTFRRDGGDVYVALDWGQSGGGHGHPDRLNVLFAHGAARWLDDLGTGSYVDQSLHWYRSTLAHNAPLVNGHSQDRVDGRLLAHDERGGFGWILAEADIADGVRVQRALVVSPDYFIDEVRWTSDRPVRFELPVHFGAPPASFTFTPARLDGGDGLEDGFVFARKSIVSAVRAMTPVELSAEHDGRHARAWVCADKNALWFHAAAPGQPASALCPFNVIRCEGDSGIIRSVWAWSPRVSSVTFNDDHIHVALGAEQHEHWLTPEYWQVELRVGGAHSGIELFGWTPREDEKTGRREDEKPRGFGAPLELHRDGAPLVFVLGEHHYRRSEESWQAAGGPTATVKVTAERAELIIDIAAKMGALLFSDAATANPYDNEHSDINAHGVQLYLRTPIDGGAWVVVPESASENARVRRLAAWGSLELRGAVWKATADGFSMQLRIALPPGAARGEFPLALDVLINETTPARERRRGQLVMSGAEGEFVYLQGDRHDPNRLVPIVLKD